MFYVKVRKCGAGCEYSIFIFPTHLKKVFKRSDNGSVEELDEEELQTEVITDFFHEEKNIIPDATEH